MNDSTYSGSFFRELVTKIGANPRFHDEAIRSSDIVIVAVPKDFYVDLPLDLFEGKVVVDVSNRNSVARKSTLYEQCYLFCSDIANA